jgi:hypothetical protein
MTLPANIRINTSVPFPSLVTGSGPITVSKVNGKWTIGFNPALFGVQTLPLANQAGDYAFVYDSVAKALILVPLTAFSAGGRPQRSITSSANLPIVAADSILNINAATDLTAVVPAGASRAGAPLTFKNLPGSHIQTLQVSGMDTFDGQVTFPLAPGAAVTLVPYNDGVNSGYGIE